MNTIQRPEWIRAKVSWSDNSTGLFSLMKEKGLHSVCQEASCPNKGECWQQRQVTLLLLGNVCTRGCGFCNVFHGNKGRHNIREPYNAADAVHKLGVKYVVLTSVTRDDLADGGTEHFVETVREIKKVCPDILIELLVPDMKGDRALLEKIASCGAVVAGHNIEMPEKLYPAIRPRSDYSVSIKALRALSSLKNRENNILVKSAMIIGLGEERSDITTTLTELRDAGVDIFYAGQYLSPSSRKWTVKKHYTPEEFLEIEKEALDLGFKAVMSGPMVRSSYRAHEVFRRIENT